MSTRRRIGVSVATTEAARRQLMQPVPIWEKQWAVPVSAPPDTTLKVMKWVKTERFPDFGEEQVELADAPLPALPDEPEVVEGDEEVDQDEQAPTATAPLPEGSEPPLAVADIAEEPSKPPSPKAQQLMLGTEETEASDPNAEVALDVTLDDALDTALDGTLNTTLDGTLDAALNGTLDATLDTTLDSALDTTSIDAALNADDLNSIDMSALGPDGVPFEASHELTQLTEDPQDSLLSGVMMDQSEDPFAATTES